MTEIIHACPPEGSGLTPCCGKTPFELPLGDRISSEPDAVTCLPAPAPELRDQIAAAMREHYLSSSRDEADADGNMPCRCGDWREPGPMGSDEDDWDTHLADAVLAVPAIRALTEARDALRHAEGDRDAADEATQQLRELLELAQDGAKGWQEECGKAVRRIERVQSAAESDPPLEKFMGEEPTEYARGWAAAMAAIEAALTDQPQPPAA